MHNGIKMNTSRFHPPPTPEIYMMGLIAMVTSSNELLSLTKLLQHHKEKVRIVDDKQLVKDAIAMPVRETGELKVVIPLKGPLTHGAAKEHVSKRGIHQCLRAALVMS